jgi:hypothetical protein
MTAPILKTKLYPPTAVKAPVARERLFARLDGALESRLTAVIAPAGFGKTTLVAHWTGMAEGGRKTRPDLKSRSTKSPVRSRLTLGPSMPAGPTSTHDLSLLNPRRANPSKIGRGGSTAFGARCLSPLLRVRGTGRGSSPDAGPDGTRLEVTNEFRRPVNLFALWNDSEIERGAAVQGPPCVVGLSLHGPRPPSEGSRGDPQLRRSATGCLPGPGEAGRAALRMRAPVRGSSW